MKNCNVTVFTPTYNRAHTLEKLYNSLLNQTCFDFEWLIIDDGSTDNTSEIVGKLISNNNRFLIRYEFQENHGKHVAINKGVNLANGDLFFIVDSDDYLTNTAIETIRKWEKTICNTTNFAGVAGNKGFTCEKIIGSSFSGEYVDATSLERNKYHIEGDKAEVFYTNILKKFPFPVFDDERFITESVVWYKIASDNYKIRWFNEIIYIAEYLDDGLTAKQVKLYEENPRGFALSVKQNIKYLNYNKKQIDAAYFDYYQIVKNNISLSKAADYLEIKTFTLVKSIFCYYFRVAKDKVFGRKKNDS